MKDNVYYIPKMEETFYRNINKFNDFKTLSDEDKKRIFILAEKFKKNRFDNNLLNNYIKIIQFLTSPQAKILLNSNINNDNFTFKSFDEAALFLIYCIDPFCESYKAVIHNIKNMKSKDIEHLVRSKLGFYNNNFFYLLKRYFLNNMKTLMTDVKMDYSNRADILLSSITNFDNIDAIRYEEIKSTVNDWISISRGNTKAQTCFYNVICQSNLLQLNNNQEIALFIIMTLDPDLKLLQIFEEECVIKNIKNRAITELGFFSYNLIKIESIYHEIYRPDIEIESWTKQKRK